MSASNVRNWRAAGKPIRTQRQDDDGRPVDRADATAWIAYHLGDVIAIATATPTRRRGPRCRDCRQFPGACSRSGCNGTRSVGWRETS